MKILHVNNHLASKGGVETYLLALIPELEQLGVECGVAYAQGDAELARKSHLLPTLSESGKSAQQAGAQAIHRLLNDEQYDVVHLHNIHNTGAIEACLAAVPTILTTHDYRYTCPASNYFFRRTQQICERTCGPGCFVNAVTRRCLTPRPKTAWRYYRRVQDVLKSADRFAGVIAPSQSAALRVIQAGFSAGQTTVLPYFCPIEPLVQPRDVSEKPMISFIGRLSENKGYRQFISALGLLPDAVQGQIVGNLNSQREAEVQRLAREAGCADRLQVHPWAGRDEIRELLQRTSVLIFPSLWPETLGIIGLEALATGVPVVASNVGGVQEWLIDGVTGRLVPPGDPQEIANKTQEILDDPELSRQMGRAGLDLIREKFSVSAHVDQLVEVYERTAGRKRTNSIVCHGRSNSQHSNL